MIILETIAASIADHWRGKMKRYEYMATEQPDGIFQLAAALNRNEIFDGWTLVHVAMVDTPNAGRVTHTLLMREVEEEPTAAAEQALDAIFGDQAGRMIMAGLKLRKGEVKPETTVGAPHVVLVYGIDAPSDKVTEVIGPFSDGEIALWHSRTLAGYVVVQPLVHPDYSVTPSLKRPPKA